jgi:hypothetical protein
MKQSVVEYVKKCDSCAVQKQLKMNEAPMGQFIVGEPMERVAMENRNFVVTCQLSCQLRDDQLMECRENV